MELYLKAERQMVSSVLMPHIIVVLSLSHLLDLFAVLNLMAIRPSTSKMNLEPTTFCITIDYKLLFSF